MSAGPSADAASTATKKSRSYAARWQHPELLATGYLVVPSVFMRQYSRLKPYSLTHGEALFVLHLMEFKWDQDAPFPSYGTLSRRMGVSTKMVRRYALALEQKGYVRRVIRKGNTNRFDLEPLFDKLLKVVESAPTTAASTPLTEDDLPF